MQRINFLNSGYLLFPFGFDKTAFHIFIWDLTPTLFSPSITHLTNNILTLYLVLLRCHT